MDAENPTAVLWRGVSYGLDAGGTEPVAVRAVRRWRRVTFSRTTLEAVRAAPEVRSRRAILAVCLLQRESLARWLRAPYGSARTARKVFPSLLDLELPFPLDECRHAILQTVRSGPVETRGLVAAARHADIAAALDRWQALGIAPHVLDQEGLALWSRGLDECPPAPVAPRGGDGEVRAVLYLGPDRVILAVGRGSRFLGAHALRRPDGEAVHRLLRAHFESAPPRLRWIAVGPLAADRAPVEALHAELSRTWPGPLTVPAEPEAFLARAAAARALGRGALRCNLRAGRFLHPDLARRQQRDALAAALLCLLAGATLCGVNVGWRVAHRRHAARLQAAITAAARAISPAAAAAAGSEALVARRIVDDNARRLQPLLAAGQGSRIATLRRILDIAGETGLRLETLDLTPTTLSLSGTAPGRAALDQAVRGLQPLGLRVQAEAREEAADGRVAFGTRAEVRGD